MLSLRMGRILEGFPWGGSDHQVMPPKVGLWNLLEQDWFLVPSGLKLVSAHLHQVLNQEQILKSFSRWYFARGNHMATIISSFYVLIQILCKAKEDVPRVRWFSTFSSGSKILECIGVHGQGNVSSSDASCNRIHQHLTTHTHTEIIYIDCSIYTYYYISTIWSSLNHWWVVIFQKGLRKTPRGVSPEERCEGEFRSLRVCRCLGDAWSLDVELLRWGEAEVPSWGCPFWTRYDVIMYS